MPTIKEFQCVGRRNFVGGTSKEKIGNSNWRTSINSCGRVMNGVDQKFLQPMSVRHFSGTLYIV